ncbi:MAG: hypothetical protein JXB29_06540 [Sedimentisphaerales bacterium]|nr:hypothetical protein [Sedimentisphaerales bacterium]
MLHGIDTGVIISYFVIVTVLGLLLSKKASASLDDYFLGGHSIPWFILGVSGMATYVDMSGTMLQTSFFYMFGVKGYWVAFRGAIALILAFLMIFMGKWLNRSGVMTNSQLMGFRFGRGIQGTLAKLLTALSVMIVVVPCISYFFVGASKFLAMYIPGLSPNTCGIIFFGIVLVYTVASGFYGVVYTDLLQSVLVMVVIVFITLKALTIGTAEYYAANAPQGWFSLSLSDWPPADLPEAYANMKFLGVLLIFWIASNIFIGFAQPHDAWTSQRYYAAKNERESSLIACQWVVMMSFRFLLMMAIAVLAISIKEKIAEPEMALPAVIQTYFPIGLKGLFIAALIAAAMSTLDSIINSSAVYFVKDLYGAFIRPRSSDKHLIKVSYITTIAIVVLGVALGLKIPNINSIWAWIIMGLTTGVLAPNILKWFWWRFNGMGFAFGMAFGLLSAIIQKLFLPDAPEHIMFCLVMSISTLGTIIGVFFGKPTEMEVLIEFYKRIKPFGFWGPVRQACDPTFVAEVKKENRRDLLLLGPACIWQVMLFWMMTALVVKKWGSFFASLAIVTAMSVILYKYWYKNLKTGG